MRCIKMASFPCRLNAAILDFASPKCKTSHRSCALTAEHGVLQALCNTLLCGQYPHSLGYFPMQRALKFSLLPPPRPSFSRQRLCNYVGIIHITDDTAQAVILSTWLSSRAILARSMGKKQKGPILTQMGK